MMERDKVIGFARMALSELQRTVPGTENEGSAIDDLARRVRELAEMHQDVCEHAVIPEREPAAPVGDSWREV